MSSSARQIHVTLAFDDNFWAPAFAVARSICLTSLERENLVLHLLHDRMQPARRTDFDGLVAEFGVDIRYYDISTHAEFNATCRALPVHKRLHTVMYARLLVDRILPAEVERLIYLDCDTMVVAPIERLFDYHLGGRPIAAVRDTQQLLHVYGRDMREKLGIFDPRAVYFNSGVLLIDRPRYAAAGIPARVEALRAEGVLQKLYYDQDILNLVFAGDWTELPWRFNVIDPRLPHEALQPFIVHYTGHNRPWKLLSTVAFRRAYRHVMTNELFYRYMRHRMKVTWMKRLRRLVGRR